MGKNKKLNRIIVVSGNLYRRKKGEPSSSGSDISLEANIDELLPYVKSIDVVSLNKDGLPGMETIRPGLTVYRVSESQIAHQISKLNLREPYDFLLTQLLLSDIAIKIANRLKIKVVYFFRSLGVTLDFRTNGEYKVDVLVANSAYVAKKISEQYSRNTEIINFSLGNLKRVRGMSIKHPRFDVTMFNPTEDKGGKIFFSLARDFPKLKFRAILGWMDLKTIDGKSYDPELMRLMTLAHSGQDKNIYIPSDLPIPNLDNLTISRPQFDVGEIYQDTRLILVPSQWDEAIARVIIEAAINGKPVLASRVAGIPQAFKIAGYSNDYMVENYKDPIVWKNKLSWLFENYKEVPKPKPRLPKPNLHEILLKYKQPSYGTKE